MKKRPVGVWFKLHAISHAAGSFPRVFIFSWAKATAPTHIYCTHGRANQIHTSGKNKVCLLSEKRQLKGERTFTAASADGLSLFWCRTIWCCIKGTARWAITSLATALFSQSCPQVRSNASLPLGQCFVIPVDSTTIVTTVKGLGMWY